MAPPPPPPAEQLRSRRPQPKPPTTKPSSINNPSSSPPPPTRKRISTLDILRVLLGIFLLSSTLSYFVTNESFFWNHTFSWAQPARVRTWLRGDILLSDDELLRYNGTDRDLPIYLALNGTVYDVSASPHIYGPGGSYHFFAGRDATRAFVTGCFAEDLTADLRGVEEMYVPLDMDEMPEMGEGIGEEVRRKVRREWKLRREKVWREGREKVKTTVAGWRKTFDGGKGGKYWRVGRVVREEGWEGKQGRRELCQKAKEGRPKTSKEAVD